MKLSAPSRRSHTRPWPASDASPETKILIIRRELLKIKGPSLGTGDSFQ